MTSNSKSPGNNSFETTIHACLNLNQVFREQDVLERGLNSLAQSFVSVAKTPRQFLDHVQSHVRMRCDETLERPTCKEQAYGFFNSGHICRSWLFVKECHLSEEL